CGTPDPATPVLDTLSLHDALPIYRRERVDRDRPADFLCRLLAEEPERVDAGDVDQHIDARFARTPGNRRPPGRIGDVRSNRLGGGTLTYELALEGLEGRDRDIRQKQRRARFGKTPRDRGADAARCARQHN